jgi:hypothetical protein
VQLGLENKKKTMWAAALGALAVLAVGYQVTPMFLGPPSTGSSAQAAAPAPVRVTATRPTGKLGKKQRTPSLDPTLRLELLAASEKTLYEGSGRNIFVSQAVVDIPKPAGPGVTDNGKPGDTANAPYVLPTPTAAPPIPLKYYGFASKAGEPKKIFLKLGEDVWVAGEGEIIDRRYKVVHISPMSVDIQDVVNSGPPQSIPLTQG